MKRLLVITTLILGLWTADAQESFTTHSSVTAYLQTLLDKPVGVINQRVDQLIDSVGKQNPELQSKVAGIAFDYFSDSPVMGHESVSVHIADNWFLNQRLPLENEQLMPLIQTYAEFNRSSLVGKNAPPLAMEDSLGVRIEVRDAPSAYKVLFFYDTDCSTCRREAPLLADLARSYHGEPLTLFAIYTQSDSTAWKAYVREVFQGIDNPDVTVVHLWDPEAATGFHKKYAVLSTPMMFLLDNQNVILGRRLDCDALARMLDIENAQALQYKQLFDNIFNTFEPLSAEDVEDLIDTFAEKTQGNKRLYTEVMINLFNYLRGSERLAKQQGALYLAEKHIVSEPDYWSEEFLDRTFHALAKARLNPVGAKATQLELQNKRGKPKAMLSGRHWYTLVLFHLIDCEQCQREIAELKKLRPALYDLGIHVVLVYAGDEQERWKQFVKQMQPCRWTFLNDFKHTSNMRMLYDLEYVPHLYLLDSEGVIIAKDIRVSELKELMPYL